MLYVYYHVIYVEVTGGVFSNTSFPGVKVTVVFVPKLSGPRCIYYHAICIEVTEVCFNNFFSGLNLPQCLYLHYQICDV